MELTLEVLGVISCLELLVWTTPLWRLRKAIAGTLIFAISVITGVLLSWQLNGWVLILSVLSIYRIINLLRLVQGRGQADFLYHASRQAAFWLIGSQIIIVVTAKLGAFYHINSLSWFYLLTILEFVGSPVLLVTVIRQVRSTMAPVMANGLALRDLPALTVAIPARNETADLEACLRSLVGSTYPKLEILVLDDCSQNKHTPEIIRGFAHDGVRFIAGKLPPSNWLAKNYAYAQLSDEASGEILLFCGVDVRFEQDSLVNIVKTMLNQKKSMMSIIPRNDLSVGGKVGWQVLQPNRYAWELAIPRSQTRRPPVLSTCWIITASALQAAGGFKAVTRKVVPESYLAKRAAGQEKGYSFMQSASSIGLTCQKSINEQHDTAIRTRYPQLHRRLELVALIGLLEFALLAWPFIIVVVAVISRKWALVFLAGAACVINMAWYSKIVNLTYRKFSGTTLCLFPFAVLYDIVLLNYSMWQYEFSEVIWKGRNVCIPLMQVRDKD